MSKIVLFIALSVGFICGVGRWLLSSNERIETSTRALITSPEFQNSMSKIVSHQNLTPAVTVVSVRSPSPPVEKYDVDQAARLLGDPNERDRLLQAYFRSPSDVIEQLVSLSAVSGRQRDALETIQFIETTGITPETQVAVLTILEQIISKPTQEGLREYAASLRDARLLEMSGEDREPAAFAEPAGESATIQR
jgi:hypothetical protein